MRQKRRPFDNTALGEIRLTAVLLHHLDIKKVSGHNYHQSMSQICEPVTPITRSCINSELLLSVSVAHNYRSIEEGSSDHGRPGMLVRHTSPLRVGLKYINVEAAKTEIEAWHIQVPHSSLILFARSLQLILFAIHSHVPG